MEITTNTGDFFSIFQTREYMGYIVCGKQQGCGGVSSMHISIAFDFLCLAN
jgi:hypothetical protein